MTSLGRRLLAVPIVVWGAATLVFLVLRVVPGDAVNQAAGLSATPEQREQIRAALGLDQPVLTQYFIYLGGLVRGDLGTSFTRAAASPTCCWAPCRSRSSWRWRPRSSWW
jgi:peptide/nickel transport system permease protein